MQIEIRGIERLSFRERQVVALKETGHSNQEIARRLNVSLTTVATLYSRAKAKGYQVVLVISGDPLNLYGGNDGDMTERPPEPEGRRTTGEARPQPAAPKARGTPEEHRWRPWPAWRQG